MNPEQADTPEKLSHAEQLIQTARFGDAISSLEQLLADNPDHARAHQERGHVLLSLNRSGLEQWRHFEPWLDPLKEALGPELLPARGRT